jgi:hypothetical protein
MDNINLKQAQEIAQRELDRSSPQHHFTLLPSEVQEFAFGWVFAYAPRKYLESHDRDYMVPGAGPLVVERDGSTQFLPSRPPGQAIAEFARQWRARHH